MFDVDRFCLQDNGVGGVNISIDCDGVLLNSGRRWMQWLEDNYELKEEYLQIKIKVMAQLGKFPYDVSVMYHIPPEDDPMAYWKSSHLYDGVKPLKEAIEYTDKLKQEGHTLVCVSRITGQHASSKAKWLKKWFDFDGILFTGNNLLEKTFVKCDIIVEDSLKQLNAFPNKVHRLWFDTQYEQADIEPNHGIILCKGWKHVYNEIQQIEQERQIKELRMMHGVYN